MNRGELACDVNYCYQGRNRKPTKQRSRECCLCGQDKDTVECSATFLNLSIVLNSDDLVPAAFKDYGQLDPNVLNIVTVLKRAEGKQQRVAFANHLN